MLCLIKVFLTTSLKESKIVIDHQCMYNDLIINMIIINENQHTSELVVENLYLFKILQT